MKKKVFMLLALAMTVMAASAEAPAFKLTAGTNEHGTFAFLVNDVAQTPDINGVIGVDENDVITLTVTPDQGWTVNMLAGEWYAAIAAARGQRRTTVETEDISLAKDIEMELVDEDESTGAKTYTFRMIRANVEVSATYDKLLSNDDIDISDIADVTYNGNAQTPVVTVSDGQTTLTEGTDYIVQFDGNTNAGTATINIIAIPGSGYSGQVSVTFTILAKYIYRTWVTSVPDQEYNGGPLTPDVRVMDDEKLLVKDRDYIIVYWDNVEIGLAHLSVIGINNYDGEVIMSFNIVESATTAINDVANGSPVGYIYDLNGRKVANGQWSMVNGQLKKGVYILNGKKVVIK